MSLASRSFLSSARVSATWTRPRNPVTWVANLWSGSRKGKGGSRSVRHWAINGDYVTLRPTGVVRYAREVTLQLDALMAERHPLTRGLHLELIVPRQSDTGLTHIPTRLVREFKYPRLPQFWVQAQLPFYVKGGLLSFCNLAPVTVSRQIVCIHDLHTRLMPESYGLLFRWAHRIILPLLGRRAALITTVSGLSRQHLVDFGVAAREKIVITYNGADHAGRWVAGRSRLLGASARPYVVCLGRDLKYKNTELMFRLSPFLDEMGLDLLIAGDVDLSVYCRDGAHPTDNVRLLGRIDDDEFARVLSRALCFLFPSRIEGFGLPAIEAMVHGCPVVASRSPCLPEICGDAALFADPDSIDDWLDAIAKLRDDKELRTRLVDKGHVRAASFSWRKIAELYLQLMAEVDGVEHLELSSTRTLLSAEHG